MSPPDAPSTPTRPGLGSSLLVRRVLTPLSVILPLGAALLDDRLTRREVPLLTWGIAAVTGLLAVTACVAVARSIDRLSGQLDTERLHYRELFDSLPDGIYETTLAGELKVANEPLAAMLGYDSAQQLLASVESASTLLEQPYSRDKTIGHWLWNGQGGSREVALRRTDGTPLLVDATFRSLVGEDGAVLGLRGTVRDLRPVLAQRKQLAEAQDRYRAAFEEGPLGRIVLDLRTEEMRVVQVNTALAEMLGRTVPEVMAIPPFSLVHPDDAPMDAQALADAMTNGPDTVSYRTRRLHRDGSWIPVRLTGSIHRGADGEPLYAMATIEDLRPRLAAEAETDRAWEETLRRLAEAVEYRDDETGSHLQRMSLLCALIAEQLGWSPTEVEDLRAASQLHDAGKVGIADAILRKPGRLTAEERREMERHADIGHQLLCGTGNELLELASTVAWTHHERWDGTGYPRGLRGEEIPLSGRIAAVADVFDALTSDRVYRRGMPPDEALAFLEDARGEHFDPTVVDAFVVRFRDAVGLIAPNAGAAPAR